MKKLRWGILGVNWIAQRVVDALHTFENVEIVAAAARTKANVEKFAAQNHIPKVYTSCEALASDPDIDIIYVSTPHADHLEHTKICMDHGKHVLCEKPMTLNAAMGEEMFAYADKKELFLMEAMKTRFLPAMLAMKDLIRAGEIGDVKRVHTEFCFRNDLSQTGSRYFDPALGGGALLDLGVYNLTVNDMFFEQEPRSIVSQAFIGPTGVDLRNAVVMDYGDGKMATFHTALDLNTSNMNYIYGEKGYLSFDNCSGTDHFAKHIGQPVNVELPFPCNGYEYELNAVHQAIRNSQKEDPLLPRSATLRILRQMDAIRAQWGLKYPQE